MTCNARFDIYEEVRIQTSDPAKSRFNSELAVIVGRTETEDGTSWYYTVDFLSTKRGWCFYENELESTGRKYRREDFYDGSSVRVRVDEEGRGSIVSDE
jgi:hypothetical protein